MSTTLLAIGTPGAFELLLMAGMLLVAAVVIAAIAFVVVRFVRNSDETGRNTRALLDAQQRNAGDR